MTQPGPHPDSPGSSALAPPALLLVSHGTQSDVGTRTTWRLRDAVAAARPDVDVRLCFLDFGDPSLPDALADALPDALPDDDRAAPRLVVVPLLLSTGYHVQVDIPAAVGALPNVVLARHLGPHPVLTDALVDRLGQIPPGTATVLAAAGSRRPEAAAELRAAADMLAERLGTPVRVLTMSEPLTQRLTEYAGPDAGPVRVATYLLTEGQFVDALESAAPEVAVVAPPLGTHPALTALVWLRYDDAVAARGR